MLADDGYLERNFLLQFECLRLEGFATIVFQPARIKNSRLGKGGIAVADQGRLKSNSRISTDAITVHRTSLMSNLLGTRR